MRVGRWGTASLVGAALLAGAAWQTGFAKPAAAVIAQPGGDDWATAKGYLPKGALDSIALLGPPPTPSSLAGQADQARFEETRPLQGSPRWTLAARDADLRGGVVQRFSCAAGARLDGKTPRLLKMLFKLQYDVRDTGDPAKNLYSRPRPLVGNDKPICVKRETWMLTNGSYPSGHSMIGWSWGLVLSELAPDRAETLMENARDFGESRVICGVHYESDIEAGRRLASAMVAREHADPVFRADMAAAKLELARARKGPAPEGCDVYSAK
jgi:acid phosphatase (class A)